MTNKTATNKSYSRDHQKLFRLFTMILVIFVASYPMVSEATTDKVRRPLDLPAGGGNNEEEDEEIPDVIQFFGQDFEGDAFVWVLDTSGSMSVGGNMQQLREEFVGAVSSLSSETEFGVIAFNQNLQELDSHCKEATTSRKMVAAAWVVALPTNGSSCISPAVIRGLEIARKSSKEQRRVILVGDGGSQCGSTTPNATQDLINISMANWDRIAIDTVFVGGHGEGLDFYQALANQNQGRLTISQ
ncbi:MAG: vWA domain-containing protein [Planctomycetota bacterium]